MWTLNCLAVFALTLVDADLSREPKFFLRPSVSVSWVVSTTTITNPPNCYKYFGAPTFRRKRRSVENVAPILEDTVSPSAPEKLEPTAIEQLVLDAELDYDFFTDDGMLSSEQDSAPAARSWELIVTSTVLSFTSTTFGAFKSFTLAGCIPHGFIYSSCSCNPNIDYC